MRQMSGKKRKIDTYLMTNPKIIFDHNDFFVLDKPPGWIVNNSETTRGLTTIQDWIKDNIKSQISYDIRLRSGIVHRLDKDTSGCLLVSKSEKSFLYLQELFQKKTIEKKYTALVHGTLIGDGIVKTPVGRLPWNRERFGILLGGRDSETKYVSASIYKLKNDTYTLVDYFPKTGRTHQIRIHSKYLGHPIVSDNFYAGRKTYRKDILWCPRLFLHATNISFNYFDKKINVESVLPEDLKTALNHLEKSDVNK